MQEESKEQTVEHRADGYKNLMNKYGTSDDVSEQYRFESGEPVTDIELTINYEENGLFSKIIDIPADDAVSSGFKYGITDTDMEKFINKSLEKLDFEGKAATAIKWSRLYGGALMVMLIDDGKDLEEPVDWDNIRGIDELLVFERPLVTPDYQRIYNYKPKEGHISKFGMPEFYDVSPIYGSPFRVHESRCLLFRNGILPSMSTRTEYRFFGIPEYARINNALQKTVTSHGNGAKLLDKAVQAIYKMKDLAELLATDEGENKVLDRLRLIDLAKGIINSIAIDADGEDYDYKQITFSGVKDVIDSTCNMLSAVTNIPQTKLFGRSPAGENSTGESDMENYYTFVGKIQKLNLKNNMGTLIDIILIAGRYQGEFEQIPDYELKFKPLWNLSEKEQAEVDKVKADTEFVKAQTAQVYVDMQALDASEIRSKLSKNGEFTINDVLNEEEGDWNELGGLQPEAEQESGKTSDTALTSEFEEDNRNYKKEYEEYGGKPEQIHNRTLRNKARKEMGLKVGDPREVDHKVPLSKGGSNSKRNLRITSRTENRKKGNKMDEEERNCFHMIPTGCGVIVVKDGKILIGERKDNGLICGPGGHIELGETPEDAAIRETREEFGINIAELIPVTFLSDMPPEYCPSQVFLCTKYFGNPICFNQEMENARFESVSNVLKYKMFLPFELSVRELLNQLYHLNQETVHDDGWITVNGQHIKVNENEKQVGGNTKVLGGTGKGVDYKDAREYTKIIKGVKTVKGTEMKKVSVHAAIRMKERNISPNDVKDALTGAGIIYPGNSKHPDAECYQYRGMRMVVSSQGVLITAIDLEDN